MHTSEHLETVKDIIHSYLDECESLEDTMLIAGLFVELEAINRDNFDRLVNWVFARYPTLEGLKSAIKDRLLDYPNKSLLGAILISSKYNLSLRGKV